MPTPSRGYVEGGSPPARFIDPAVLARIGNLKLVARTVVDGFISGAHRSALPGLSLDFAEHRAYMPGDDVRRIDWRVYARTDRLYVKEFEADTNANTLIVFDVSRSMNFGEPVTKLAYGRFLAASIAYLSSQQRDRVGLVCFDSDVVNYVPPSVKHLDIILQTLERLEPGGASDYDRAFRKIAEGRQRRSIVILISDLYEEPDRLLRGINQLGAGRHDVVIFHVLDAAELELPYQGPTQFRDLETGTRLPAMPEQARDRYHELMTEHRQRVGRGLRNADIDYAFADSSKPLDQILFRYLMERAKLRRVR